MRAGCLEPVEERGAADEQPGLSDLGHGEGVRPAGRGREHPRGSDRELSIQPRSGQPDKHRLRRRSLEAQPHLTFSRAARIRLEDHGNAQHRRRPSEAHARLVGYLHLWSHRLAQHVDQTDRTIWLHGG